MSLGIRNGRSRRLTGYTVPTARKQREKRKWGWVIILQDPPPVTHFLQVFKHMSPTEDISYSNHIILIPDLTLAFLLPLTSWEADLRHRPIRGFLAEDLGEINSGKHKH